MYENIKQEELTPLENELLIHFRHIWHDTLRKLAIDQVRIVGELDSEDLAAKSEKYASLMRENKKETENLMKKKGKKE